MSRFFDPQAGDDHPEAAAKHLNDAYALYEAERFDGAAYHAGYVVECSLKTLLLLDGHKERRSHRLNGLSAKALLLSRLVGSKSARYAGATSSDHQLYDYDGTGWKESMRYAKAGRISKNQADNWVAEATKVYHHTVGKMRLDGVLK